MIAIEIGHVYGCEAMETEKMEYELYQLIYASVATRPIPEDELFVMLNRSRENNARLGITGMLLHCDGCFIQALEGPKDKVVALLKVIARDSRHQGLQVLFEGPIKERRFSQWSMGFKRPSQEALDRIEGYTPFLDVGDDPAAIQAYSGVAIKLLKVFRELSDTPSS
jgi:hypothetical protein